MRVQSANVLIARFVLCTQSIEIIIYDDLAPAVQSTFPYAQMIDIFYMRERIMSLNINFRAKNFTLDFRTTYDKYAPMHM